MSDLSNKLAEVQKASRELVKLSEEEVNTILNDVADNIMPNADMILAENKKDLDKMDKNDPKYDRLQLTKERLEGIASDMRNVAKLDFPLGKVLEHKTLDNGLDLRMIIAKFGGSSLASSEAIASVRKICKSIFSEKKGSKAAPTSGIFLRMPNSWN